MVFSKKIAADEKKITELVKLLNEACNRADKIKVNRVHKWLKANGYVDKKRSKKVGMYKHVTKAGKEAGLKNVSMYDGTVYNFVFTKKGCEFMLEHVEDIANFEV